jgi:imidazole glycerol-phosphate synthase subunit HisF
MALTIRVIPCLDVANGRVVKGVNFANLVDSGDPVELATRYYLDGADEITFLDVNASKEGRSTILDLVARTAESVFIPLTVGGGISSTKDVAALLAAGADKVSVGSSGIANPQLLSDISDLFGSQVLVVSLDIQSDSAMPSGYAITSHGGSKSTGLDAVAWINQVQSLGAGELLVNSIDADGTKRGFDLELLRMVSEIARVPFIASGGAGEISHFTAAASAGADAVLAASVFHSGQISISEVKSSLFDSGYQVRLVA